MASSVMIFSRGWSASAARTRLLGDLGEHRRRGDRRVEGPRPRDGPHVGEADAHGDGSAGERLGAEPRGYPIGEVTQGGREDPLDGGPPSERGLRAGGSRPAMRADFARIAVPGERAELLAGGMAEQALERAARHVRQLSDGEDALLGELRPGDGTDAPHQADRQIVEELELGRGIDHDQTVRLGDLRGDLRQVLGARHADRDGETEFGPDASADRGGDLGGGAEEMRAARDVGEGLVDRDPLHQRREVAEDGDGRVAEALILAEVPADEDELRAQLARLPAGHAAADTEGLRLVGGGEHHAAADGDRPALQAWIEQLLDRGVEGVEIGMEDGGLRLHGVNGSPASSP